MGPDFARNELSKRLARSNPCLGRIVAIAERAFLGVRIRGVSRQVANFGLNWERGGEQGDGDDLKQLPLTPALSGARIGDRG